MYYPEKKGSGCKGSPESSTAPTKLFARPEPADANEIPAFVDNAFVGRHITDADYPVPPLPPAPPKEHPEPHRGYVIASLVLTGIAGLTSIGTIVVEAVGIVNIEKHPRKGEGENLTYTITELFLILMLVESILCFIAMLTCFGLLLSRPYRVLIRNPSNGPFGCLCATVFILFLCSVFTVTMQIFCGIWSPDRVASPGVCAIPCVRAVALISFFAVLVANSMLHPRDLLM